MVQQLEIDKESEERSSHEDEDDPEDGHGLAIYGVAGYIFYIQCIRNVPV